MKNLLLFLTLVLTLSACENYDLSRVKQGQIEKIENETTAYIDGVDYQFEKGVKDYLTEETLAVGDTVTLYSDGADIVLSKCDDIVLIKDFEKKVSVTRFFVGENVFWLLLFVLMAFSILWAFLESAEISSDNKIIKALVSPLNYFFRDKTTPLISYVFQFPLLCLFAYFLWACFFVKTLNYCGEVQVDDFTRHTTTLQGRIYPNDDLVLFQRWVLPGDVCLMYQQGNKIYLYDKSKTHIKNPEIVAQIINKKNKDNARFHAWLWGILWGISVSSFAYLILGYLLSFVVDRFGKSWHRKNTLVENVDASGGHGAFLKE